MTTPILTAIVAEDTGAGNSHRMRCVRERPNALHDARELAKYKEA